MPIAAEQIADIPPASPEPAALDTLDAVGRAAFGADWHRPMARALGPHHPAGDKTHIDDRLVRRWVSGDRPVPGWVVPALPGLLRRRAAALARRAAALGRMAAALEHAPATDETSNGAGVETARLAEILAKAPCSAAHECFLEELAAAGYAVVPKDPDGSIPPDHPPA